jgi:hypothetical protein
MKNEFTVFNEFHGLLVDDKRGTKIYGFENITQERPDTIVVEGAGGCYGYNDIGHLVIVSNNETISVPEGYFFTTNSGFKVISKSEKYRFAVWQKENYIGMITVGKVESEGRLKYIDGCKDTVLSNPIKKGDPCLNALYMPKNVHQTMHTHPSTRSGFIIIGGAKCFTPDNVFPLEKGQIFYLPADREHKFRSDLETDVVMKLVAYHPDSDFGATDEIHPMINRTIVDGISASDIKDIQTK